ncbi:autotransporter outer membrane beta-barrel domain-containing protein [Bartonella sp. CR127HXZ]|uniref:autotransporter outer membrane beta-barrel domain-containing protein n=1 Tax=Bartonella sp. CR127HXZ TaxID=1460985 RepID=UPI0035D05919
MINVFKKRTSLYALTASALFLLQGVDASIASGGVPGGAGVGGVPGVGAGAGVPNAGVGGAGGLGAGVVQGGGSATVCNVASYKGFNDPLSSVVCNDGTEHSMKYSTVMVTKNGANALAVGRFAVVGGSAKTTKPTIVKLYSSSLLNRSASNADQNAMPQYGSAVFASQDGVVKLEHSSSRDFDTGLYASYGGKIVMERGLIRSAIMGAEAVNESLIMLRNTEIIVSGQQWSLGSKDEEDDLQDNDATGLRVAKGSVIDMKLGKLIVPIGVSVVVAENGGIIQLDNVSVTFNESKPNAAAQELTSLLSTDSGFISFKNGNINHSNTIGVWAFDNEGKDSKNNRRNDATSVKPIEINEPSTEFLASSDYVNYLIPKILGKKTRAGTAEERAAEEGAAEEGAAEADFRVGVSIKSSTINLSGERSVGVYFDNQTDDSEQSQKSNQLQNKESVVLLHNTTLNVPDGTVILGNNMRGSVLIDSGSNVYGNSFLHAKFTSEVSVFVNDSIVRGEADVEKGSQGKLFLFNGSKWHLTKSRFGKHNSSCEDSCVSFVKLDNSSISFLPLQNDANQQNHSHQLLRIGNGEGTVYTASWDSHIYFGASVPADASEASRLSDRLLIHGDVSGQTKVHVLPIRQNGDVQRGQDAQGYKPQSISIIQVYGEAREDSFTLNDAYVTIGGLPYQYVLRAYGPKPSSEMKYFDEALVVSGKDVWDFRLEDKNLPYEPSSLPVLGSSSKREDANTPSVQSRETEGSEVGNSSVGTSLPSGTPDVPGGSYGQELVTSDGRTSIYLLAGDVSEYSRQNANEVEYTIVGYDDSDTGYGDYNIVDVNSLGTDRSSSLPEAEDRLMVTTDEDGLTQTVEPSSTTEEAVDSSRTVSRNEAENDIVGHNTSDTVGVNSGAHRTETGDEDHTDGGYEGYYDVESEASEAVTPLLSPTTMSSVTSTVLGGDASTDLVRSEASGHSVYPVLSNSSPSSIDSVTLIPSGADSLGRSDLGRISVISADGVSGTSEYHTVSNMLTPIKSAASMKPSTSETSAKPVALSDVSAGSILMLGSSDNGNVPSKETISSTCDDMNNGEERSLTTYLCSDGKSRTIKNFTLKASDKTQHPMHVKNQDTVIKLEGAIISGADFSDSENNVDFATSKRVSAVLAEDNGEVVLDKKSKIQSSVIGLEAQSGGKIKMTGGTVDALYVGALAGSGSSVNLKDTRINVTGDLVAAGLASKAGEITMNTGAITLAKGVAVRSEAGGSVRLDKVDITVKKSAEKLDSVDNFARAAFLLSDNASVDFKNGNVVTDAHALWVIKGDDVVETGSSRKKRSSEVRPTVNHANIESSIVRVEGDGTYGIYFDGVIQKEASQQNRSKDLTTEKAIVVKRSAVSEQKKTPIGIAGTVSLKKTDFEVAKGTAIYGNNSSGHVLLENKTTLTGDLLLKAENDSNISVSVDSSIVTGDVRVDKSSYAKLDLANSSRWVLKRSAQKNLGTPDLGCVGSCVPSVRLINSAIDFRSSESEGRYQTLHIGNGNGTVYEAQGDAVIHLNARLNPHDPSDQQVTDRLVIHGDVSGKTKIHVRGDAGNVGDARANGKIAHSVSVIQVYGQAKKDSFELDGNYVALSNSPYKYTLRAYAPKATSKQEHVQQKFVKDGGEFWNFRLENQYVKSMRSAALSEQFVRSVVPQVPTYLVLPNSVFHAGLMDISNQNKQLDTLRMTSNGMVEIRENPALYLRGYGGNYRYASDLSTLEYGYGGDLDYHGVEAGVLLQTIESSDSTISFGVMGTYGKLSLQPLNVEQSKKSAFDKWTATVYGSMQHNVGFYVDGLLSYGLFKGDVLTLARGKTATLKGNPLSVSLTGGQTIETGYKGFVFDPQVQVVYQHLQFNKARDIDNFNIEMGNLDQWVARVGGRLTKTPTGSEGVNAVAFYGKLYLAHGFEGKQSVHFKDAFKLGAFGSSLEAGLGFNAKLLPQFSLHADVLYQHKLNKAGFSGTSFSGGVRYQF